MLEIAPSTEESAAVANPERSATIELLRSWAPMAGATFGRSADYSSFYHTLHAVSLVNFDRLVAFACRFEGIDISQPGAWRTIPSIDRLTNAWLEDSQELNRPYPIAYFVAMCELAQLVGTGNPLCSVTESTKSCGVRGSVVEFLARFETLPFAEIEPALEFVNARLGVAVFPRDFEAQWNAVKSANIERLGDLPLRLQQQHYTSEDLREIFAIPDNRKSTISRTLNGSMRSPNFPFGQIELLASDSLESAGSGIIRQIEFARELRQRKGRFEPHPSMIIRDVFGVEERQTPEFDIRSAMRAESGNNPNRALFEFLLGETESQVRPMLLRAIENRARKSPFIDTLSFAETMRRFDERKLFSDKVLGLSRYGEMLNGNYVPPISHLRQMFAKGEVPAFVEARARIELAEKYSASMSVAQRYCTALCEEVCDSRNNFWERDDIAQLGAMSTLQRFFRELGSKNLNLNFLPTIAESASADNPEDSPRVVSLAKEFTRQLAESGVANYPQAVSVLCDASEGYRDWLRAELRHADLRALGARASEFHVDPNGNLIELFETLKGLERFDGRSARGRAWNALNRLMTSLPGVTIGELLQISIALNVDQMARAHKASHETRSFTGWIDGLFSMCSESRINGDTHGAFEAQSFEELGDAPRAPLTEPRGKNKSGDKGLARLRRSLESLRATTTPPNAGTRDSKKNSRQRSGGDLQPESVAPELSVVTEPAEKNSGIGEQAIETSNIGSDAAHRLDIEARRGLNGQEDGREDGRSAVANVAEQLSDPSDEHAHDLSGALHDHVLAEESFSPCDGSTELVVVDGEAEAGVDFTGSAEGAREQVDPPELQREVGGVADLLPDAVSQQTPRQLDENADPDEGTVIDDQLYSDLLPTQLSTEEVVQKPVQSLPGDEVVESSGGVSEGADGAPSVTQTQRARSKSEPRPFRHPRGPRSERGRGSRQGRTVNEEQELRDRAEDDEIGRKFNLSAPREWMRLSQAERVQLLTEAYESGVGTSIFDIMERFRKEDGT